jgi:predicted RNA-binding protein Jag
VVAVTGDDNSGDPAPTDSIGAPTDSIGEGGVISAGDQAAPPAVPAERDEDLAERDAMAAPDADHATLAATGDQDAADADDDADAPADLEQESEIAADYIEGLLDVADLDGDIDMDVEGDRPLVSVVGATLTELVGPRGEVKVVHDAVAAAGLRSESEGEEPARRVVVLPAEGVLPAEDVVEAAVMEPAAGQNAGA